MVNEFRNLPLLCVPPQLIPPYGNPENQGCTLPGAVPGSPVVDGEAYLHAQLEYSYSHLWRNVGIIIGFWAVFVLMTLFGLERTLKPSKGGGTVNIYQKGREWKPSDEEAQRESVIYLEQKDISLTGMQRFAESGGLLSWERVGYAINANRKEKVLLTDISGYVKPGRMTALMGGTTSRYGS
jgi:ATP-binding cassette, subfamily G (WHITE), member 2, SNQ2